MSDRALRKVGFDSAVARVSEVRITCGRYTVSAPVSGRIVDRPAMLAGMRAKCRAAFVKGTVRSIRREGGLYELELSDGTELESRYLIGADGAHSAVRRDVFDETPTAEYPIVNCVGPGECEALEFEVRGDGVGGYSWRFPSKPGRVSVGFPLGEGDVPDGFSSSGRDIPLGRLERVVDGNCLLAGDAACLANPLCFGGIGAALESGRRAAEAVMGGSPGRYQRWVSRCPAFSRRFMDAHGRFAGWSQEEAEEALAPVAGRLSVANGLRAMLRRPEDAGVYMAVYLALKWGWRKHTPHGLAIIIK